MKSVLSFGAETVNKENLIDVVNNVCDPLEVAKRMDDNLSALHGADVPPKEAAVLIGDFRIVKQLLMSIYQLKEGLNA